MFDTICPGLTRETPSKIQGQIKKKSEEEQHEFSMMDRSVMEIVDIMNIIKVDTTVVKYEKSE